MIKIEEKDDQLEIHIDNEDGSWETTILPYEFLEKYANKMLIGEFLEGLYKYKEQIGFQKHISLDLLIEYWEEKLK